MDRCPRIYRHPHNGFSQISGRHDLQRPSQSAELFTGVGETYIQSKPKIYNGIHQQGANALDLTLGIQSFFAPKHEANKKMNKHVKYKL
jgi:hypothetical protein